MLNVRFHWLCPRNILQPALDASIIRHEPDLGNLPGYPAFRPPNDIAKGQGKDDDVPPNLRLFNCEALGVISSGDVFQITTHNPKIHPLPSFEILQLQWLMHRVRALAAAAGYRL